MFKIVGLIAAAVFIATGIAEGAEPAPMCQDRACAAIASPAR